MFSAAGCPTEGRGISLITTSSCSPGSALLPANFSWGWEPWEAPRQRKTGGNQNNNKKKHTPLSPSQVSSDCVNCLVLSTMKMQQLNLYKKLMFTENARFYCKQNPWDCMWSSISFYFNFICIYFIMVWLTGIMLCVIYCVGLPLLQRCEIKRCCHICYWHSFPKQKYMVHLCWLCF